MNYLLLFATLQFAIFVHQCQGQEEDSRTEKLLNVFNIVKFPNDGCNSTSGSYGVCYTASECDSLGGSSSGSCASGFGVCCLFSLTCGGTTSLNNTYFKSTGTDSSPCVLTVCKVSTDICQLRLGFDSFVMSQPSTSYPTDGSSNGRTQCHHARFQVSSDGPSSPVLCGTNSGQHMYVEASNDCNEITFQWQTNIDRPTWNIHIEQISCYSQWKPQDGCFQYFTGTSGYVKSFNYDNGVQLSDQEYTVCIRAELGYCSIAWASVSSTSFKLSGPSTSLASVAGDLCTNDYIVLQSGGSALPPTPAPARYDRFCGGLLAADGGTSTITIYTQKLPFNMIVNFDGTETDPISPTPTAYTENSLGFYMHWKQSTCT